MRALAVVLAGSLVAGCTVNSYRIPSAELARLARIAPEVRGQRVRVVQDVLASSAPAAPPVSDDTEVVIVPQVNVGAGFGGHARGGGSAVHTASGVGKIGGSGSDGKAAAVALLVVAATAMVAAVVIEGTRFDGYAELHPMQPVHLIGKDGSYAVMPLAWIDPGAAAFTETAVVRASEGPWHLLERAPLDRQGLTYSMYGGTGSLRSADGSLAMGPAWTLQFGVFPTQQIGIVASALFGWRDNSFGATLFETRTTAELEVLPVQLGLLHAGLYGGAGFAHRFEDAIQRVGDQILAGDDTSLALTGGAMFQLELNTRIALTARLGLAFAHGDQVPEALIGLSVY
jgi:hypothetical protein